MAQLTDFLLDRAQTVGDLEMAQASIAAVQSAVRTQLAVTPYSLRKIGKSQTRRELIVPLGATGYIVL